MKISDANKEHFKLIYALTGIKQDKILKVIQERFEIEDEEEYNKIIYNSAHGIAQSLVQEK